MPSSSYWQIFNLLYSYSRRAFIMFLEPIVTAIVSSPAKIHLRSEGGNNLLVVPQVTADSE